MFSLKKMQLQMVTVTVTAMVDTTIHHHHHKMIMLATAMATTEIMDSMVIQAIDHKMISNQLPHTIPQTTNTYLHKTMHLNNNLNDQTTNTFRQHKIVQTEMATVTSIHKADIDTKNTIAAFSTNKHINTNIHTHTKCTNVLTRSISEK